MSLRSFLNLDFLRGSQLTGPLYPSEATKLDPLITFARASTATRFNASGALETVASGQPRFDFDPVTLAPRGLLIEEARTNLLIYSGALDFAHWTASGVTRDAAAVTASGITLDNINDAVGSTTGVVYQSAAWSGSGAVALSFVAKQGTAARTIVQVSSDSGLFARVTIDWAAGVPTAAASFGGTLLGVQALAGGAYRFALAGTSPATTNLIVAAYPAGTTAGSTYLGAMQLEIGAFATSYIPTTSAPVTRAAETAKITSLAPWFNVAAGTLALEWERVTSLATAATIAATNTPNRYLGYQVSGAGGVKTTFGGVTEQTVTGGPLTGVGKLALGYSSAPILSAACNGGAVSALTATGLSLAAVNELWLGSNAAGGEQLNGYLRRVAVQPFKASDLLLKQMTV